MEIKQHLYEQIARNKRNSVLLAFGLFSLFALVGYVFGAVYEQPIIGMEIAVLFALIHFMISYGFGDKIVLLSMGAKQIAKEDNPQLFNVVEEMCIAGGLPMPKVYLIQSDASNAFATGLSPEKASIAVTTGILEQLKRDELQAVIGHEIGHVKNYDTRFAVLMAVMVGAIALLCDAFWRILRHSGGSRRSNSKGGDQAQAVFMVIAVILAIVAPIVATIIQLSVSRRRELLADNTSAELTRNPGALASALEKIAADPDPLSLANRGSQHLFIVNPLKMEKQRDHLSARSEKAGLFDTHPPIALRVRLLREMANQKGV